MKTAPPLIKYQAIHSSREQGASLVETVLLIALICISSAASLGVFSDRLEFKMRCTDYALGGGTESSTQGGMDTTSVSEEDQERDQRILEEMQRCHLAPPKRI